MKPLVFFKEKINYKLPGGEGFGAHQDAPAFSSFGQRFHVTLLVAVDPQTLENGCLEFSNPVEPYKTLEQGGGGTLDEALEDSFDLGIRWLSTPAMWFFSIPTFPIDRDPTGA